MRTLLVHCSIFMAILLLQLPECISAFAAKKKGGGKKKNASASTKKGFGAPSPKLDDTILGKFVSRMPNDADETDCPCGTGRKYIDCCAPFHHKEKSCLTMTDVLRSRYTAFSWRNIQYIIETTNEACRDYRNDQIAWAKDLDKTGMFDSFDFVSLEAGQEEQGEINENEGFIKFKVTLRAKEDTSFALAGQETVVSERSRFLRDPTTGVWSYAGGDVRSEVTGLEDTILNV